MTRQRRWQLARRAEGRCTICGQPRTHYPEECDACRVKRRRYQRVWPIGQPWRPGGVGRPPVVREGG